EYAPAIFLQTRSPRSPCLYYQPLSTRWPNASRVPSSRMTAKRRAPHCPRSAINSCSGSR
ncbi:Unknown protein, partial [Striga hermonthica]